jgi:hypothetical protein
MMQIQGFPELIAAVESINSGAGNFTTLTVTGATTLQGGATITGAASVSGLSTLTGGFAAAASSTITGGALTVTSAAGANGQISIIANQASGFAALLTMTPRSGAGNGVVHTSNTASVAISTNGGANIQGMFNNTASTDRYPTFTGGNAVNPRISASSGELGVGTNNWTFGIANAVSPTSPDRTLTVTIGSTTYYIHAKTTNN